MSVSKNSVKKKEEIVIIPCPLCNRIDTVGFLGGGLCRKYFCNECCIEFTFSVKYQKITIYYIDESGKIIDSG